MGEQGKAFIYLIVLGLITFFVIIWLRKFKFPKVGSLCLITGGVKTGKTTFGVALAISEYKKAMRSWRIRKVFARLLRRDVPEQPLLYSNIPLTVPYSPITTDILLRKRRVRFGSVLFISEASLVADSQMFRDMDLNNRLLLFNKLIGHSTHGGKVIYDTQSIGDLHYSIKRCLSEFFYIHHVVKFIPFFLLVYLREDRYSDDGVVINTNPSDVEDTLKRVLVRKSTWKKFDTYCYSTFTDDLPVADSVVSLGRFDSLKATKIPSFKGDVLNHEKKDC